MHKSQAYSSFEDDCRNFKVDEKIRALNPNYCDLPIDLFIHANIYVSGVLYDGTSLEHAIVILRPICRT
jgi:hypothetical protein